jgi:hypothetical protein
VAIHNQSTGIGLRQVHLAQRDDDGTMKVLGSPAAGVTYAGLKVNKARALSITPAEPQRIAARGDDVTYYTFQESPTESPTGELRTQQSDIDIIELITGVTDFGSGEAAQVALSTDKLGEEDALIIWGTRKAVDDVAGVRTWETYILLNATATARPQGFEVDNIGEFVWNVVCNSSDTDQFGRTMTTAIHGCTEAAYILVKTRYKFAKEAFEGNGSQATFTLAQGSNVKYNTATSPLFYFVNGVQVPATTSSAGVVTPGTVVANGAKLIVQYEYED